MEYVIGFKDMTTEEKNIAYDELNRHVSLICNIHLRETCRRILLDNKDKLLNLPAGHNSIMNGPKSVKTHHCYEGGLLTHMLGVTNHAIKLATPYKDEINMDLVLFGAILHDIGKLEIFDEYTKEGIVDGVVKERVSNLNKSYLLLNHMFIGAAFIDKYFDITADELSKCLHASKGLRQQAMHVVYSHMDTVEKYLVEAYIVSWADEIDAYMQNLLLYDRDAVNPITKDWMFKACSS